VLEHERTPHHHLDVGGGQVEDGDGEVGIDEGVVEHDVAIGIGHDGDELALLAVEEVGQARPVARPRRADRRDRRRR